MLSDKSIRQVVIHHLLECFPSDDLPRRSDWLSVWDACPGRRRTSETISHFRLFGPLTRQRIYLLSYPGWPESWWLLTSSFLHLLKPLSSREHFRDCFMVVPWPMLLSRFIAEVFWEAVWVYGLVLYKHAVQTLEGLYAHLSSVLNSLQSFLLC